MDIKQYVSDKAKKAKAASRALANISTEIKNNALFKMAAGLEKESAKLLAENKKDLDAAEQKGLSKAMIDRLTLNPGAHQGHGGRPARGGGASRSRGRGARDVAKTERHGSRQDARADRAHRHHL